MKRKDGTYDARDEQPILGCEFFENGLICQNCEASIPDDSIACPFCLSLEKNPAPPRSRHRKIDAASQERFPFPLDSNIGLD